MSLFRKKNINQIIADHEKGFSDGHHAEHGLKKVLGVKDLTFMGIAAIIGAGIFSTIGTAAYNGGPGIVFLFIITAVTCGFSALCYAEYASRLPIAGSAYTYAYVSFGEIVAWIIGWALILEYAIGNIVVAISWSGYFNNLLLGLNIHLPTWMLTDPFTVTENYQEALQKGVSWVNYQQYVDVYQHAPTFFGYPVCFNLPACIIVVLITAIAFVGIHESKKSTNLMVLFKIAVIILVIIVGFFYVDKQNWHPFLPNGFHGVLAGVSAVFYAYIGFDAISTTAEECKNPQRDLPKGMMYSLVVCTVLYILIALVLTGMVSYSSLNVNDPLAFVFEKINLPWMQYIISVSAVVATTSVLLVFQLGQPRIWMSMSRDGLLPKVFSTVHPKYKTPSFATIVTGLLVGIPSLFLPSKLVTDLTSIGTLFAFVLVCFGVLMLPKLQHKTNSKFSIPVVNGRYLIPAITILFMVLSKDRTAQAWLGLFTDKQDHQATFFLIYQLILLVVAFKTWVKKWNVIPVFGALCCLYLMIEIPLNSWLWFLVWMAIGLIIYFTYSIKKSKLVKVI